MATAAVTPQPSVDDIVKEIEGKLLRLKAKKSVIGNRKVVVDEATRKLNEAKKDYSQLEDEICSIAARNTLELVTHFDMKDFRFKNGIIEAKEDVEGWEYPEPTDEQKAAAKSKKESITADAFLVRRIRSLMQSAEKSNMKPENKAARIALLEACIRSKPEPNKDAIKAAGETIWKRLGIHRTLSWQFSVKPAGSAKKKTAKKTTKRKR